MEREPGLEHIFVSGDLVLAGDQDAHELTLEQDLADCKALVEANNDAEALQDAVGRLELSAQKIGELIYAQAEAMGFEGGEDSPDEGA